MHSSPKEKSSFEILVCIEDENLQSRIINVCTSAGYQINQSCYNFFSGNESDDFDDIPLIITSGKIFPNSTTNEIELLSKNTNTQILYLGSNSDIKLTQSIWVLTPSASDEEVLHFVAKACIMHEITKENVKFKSVLSTRTNFQDLHTLSPRMKEIYELIERIAPLTGSILLTGESGTGKSLLARHIHSLSQNKSGSFISLSCATFPRDLIESELFGSEKGAFTGAISARAGAVELADKGTLFLDEIGDLPIDLQPKLLTFLQDKITKRLGGIKTKQVSVRVISATNLSLESMVGEKRFRSDLFYRINTFHIHLPPLRERIEDIALLAKNILKRIGAERNCAEPKLTDSCLNQLNRYSWPGNIRELENVLEQVTAYSKGTKISEAELETAIKANRLDGLSPIPKDFNKVDDDINSATLSELEMKIIANRLALFDNNKAKTAKSLGISLKTLYNKLQA